MKIIENAWRVALFLPKAWKSVTLQAFFCDFMWKSLKTLGVSHFSCNKTWKKCDTSSVFADFKWQSLIFENTLCFFVFVCRILANMWECCSKIMLGSGFWNSSPESPESPESAEVVSRSVVQMSLSTCARWSGWWESRQTPSKYASKRMGLKDIQRYLNFRMPGLLSKQRIY